MKTLISLSIFLFIITSAGLAQKSTLTYKMEALGADIGTVSTTRNQVGDDIYYHSKSLFEVDLLFKTIRMEVNGYVHYQGDKMIEVTNKVTLNGEPRSHASTVWKDGKYIIQVDGETKPNLATPIAYSGSLLYHREPQGIKEAFSESSGIFMPVTLLARGKYQVVDPNNNRKMIHYYEKGVQTKVEIKHPVLTISLILQES